MRKVEVGRPWEIPSCAVTPEAHYLRRREFLRLFGYGIAGTALLPATMRAASAGFPDSLNPSFKLEGAKLTSEDSITSYNNFYEWGFAKDQPQELSNKGWKTDPWTLEIGGLCASPRKIGINEIIKLVGDMIRLVVPWKYGFKSAKSLVKIEFVSDRPKTTWNELAPNEYGFYANVNPNVDHPRWSQASERVIGGGFFSGKQPTLMFNGYEKQVAPLYAAMDLRKNF